jgi:hypothetical protein
MARGNKSSEGRKARSESGPYGGADYRAAEAKRGGGDSGTTVRGLREDLAMTENLRDYADDLKSLKGESDQSILDFFGNTIGDVQFNPYRPFTNYVDRDVEEESTDKLNAFIAFRDFLESEGRSKQELAELDEDIEDYADRAGVLEYVVRNGPDSRTEGGSGNQPAGFAKVLGEYNKSVLRVKNTIQDIILPSKRGPRGEPEGRVAKSERPAGSASGQDIQKVRNQAIVETLERKDLSPAQKATISSEIAKGFRDKKIGLG